MPTISELVRKLTEIDRRAAVAMEKLETPIMQGHADAARIDAYFGEFRRFIALFVKDRREVAQEQPLRLASAEEAAGYTRCTDWLDWLLKLAQEHDIDLTETGSKKR